MRPRHFLAYALMLQLSGHSAAAADDLTTLPFERLLAMEVYSASRYVQKSSHAPSSVTVITAADIRDHGWRTLADVARSVRGMYVSYDRNYSYLGERGFLRPGDYNTRFLLQVDGNRINDAVYDQAPMGGEFPLELDLIERIEFVPGPGSSVYGSNAFFGVINVITKKPAAHGGTRVALEAGQAGTLKASASTSWRTAGGSDLMLAASRHRGEGRDLYYREFDTPGQNHGVASGLDYERGTRLFGSLSHGAFGLSAMHAERVKGIPTASFYQPFNDPRPQTTDRQSYLNASYRAKAGRKEELSARLYWGRYDSYGDYVVDDVSRTLSHDGSSAQWWGVEATLVSTRHAGHTVLAGFDYQHDYRLHQYSFDVAPYLSYLDERRQGRRAGLYLQDEIAFSDRLLLNLGMRYDRNTGASGVFSPRVAVIYAATPATTLKAIYGTAFRVPNSYEKYYAYPGDGGQLPNPYLRKERIKAAELALVHQLDPNKRLTATVYNNIVGGLITQLREEGVPETRFENEEHTRASGLELEYEQSTLRGLTLRTSYSWSRLGSDDGQQVNAPAHMGKFNLAAPLGGSWRGALEAQYVGTRVGVNGEEVGCFWLANVNLLTTSLLPSTELSISITNLLDRNYADPGSTEHRQHAIRQDGRRLRARLVYAF